MPHPMQALRQDMDHVWHDGEPHAFTDANASLCVADFDQGGSGMAHMNNSDAPREGGYMPCCRAAARPGSDNHPLRGNEGVSCEYIADKT